jgi:alcohol dehydrogenase class IV
VSAAQKIIRGENSIWELGAATTGMNYHPVFLITGEHYDINDHDGLFFMPELTRFIKTGMNVGEEEIQKAFDLLPRHPRQAIVAIGGGAVMDLAKAVIHRCISSSIATPFFVAIPTTAGSGSEATSFAVVYKENKKYSLAHPSLLPEMVILDPQLTYSLPPYQTAVSGMDVLAQAVESYWNRNATTDSRAYSAEAIRIWKDHFLRTVNEPDPAARERMLWASHLAGKAINITRTTGPHALSYYLTAHHGVPHGQAVALLLPLFFIYNDADPELCALLGVRNANDAKDAIEAIMKQAGLATKLSDLNIDKSSIVYHLLQDVNEERFDNNPVPFDRERLRQLVQEHL